MSDKNALADALRLTINAVELASLQDQESLLAGSNSTRGLLRVQLADGDSCRASEGRLGGLKRY